MIYNTIKSKSRIIFFLFCFILLFFTQKSVIYASVPEVRGTVKNHKTGLGIPDVWVKWTVLGLESHSYRYVKTDSNGRFVFAGVDLTKTCVTPVDTDYDGTNDDKLSLKCENGGFNCIHNPHSWTAIPHKDWKGKFDSVKGDLPPNWGLTSQGASLLITGLKNERDFIDIGIFYWEQDAPSPTPSFTPTPSNSPTPTPTKIPCGSPCTGPANQPDLQCDLNCPICAPGPDPAQNICLGPSPTPSPTPSKVPCNSPCERDDQCVIECPICAPGADPMQKICQKPPTPTPTHPCDP